MTYPIQLVYRQLAIPVPVFDYIKDYQRSYEATHREKLTIAQTITAIVRDHQQNEASEAHEKTSQQPALLRSNC